MQTQLPSIMKGIDKTQLSMLTYVINYEIYLGTCYHDRDKLSLLCQLINCFGCLNIEMVDSVNHLPIREQSFWIYLLNNVRIVRDLLRSHANNKAIVDYIYLQIEDHLSSLPVQIDNPREVIQIATDFVDSNRIFINDFIDMIVKHFHNLQFPLPWNNQMFVIDRITTDVGYLFRNHPLSNRLKKQLDDLIIEDVIEEEDEIVSFDDDEQEEEDEIVSFDDEQEKEDEEDLLDSFFSINLLDRDIPILNDLADTYEKTISREASHNRDHTSINLIESDVSIRHHSQNHDPFSISFVNVQLVVQQTGANYKQAHDALMKYQNNLTMAIFELSRNISIADGNCDLSISKQTKLRSPMDDSRQILFSDVDRMAQKEGLSHLDAFKKICREKGLNSPKLEIDIPRGAIDEIDEINFYIEDSKNETSDEENLD